MNSKEISQLLGGDLDQLNTMISHTPSCLKIVSKEGKLLNMNPQGLSIIAAESLNEVLGANVYDLVADEYKEAFTDFNLKVCSGERRHLIFKIINLKGEECWMESYAAPYPLTNGEVAHIGITNDVTQRILAERELTKKREELVRSARLVSLGQFVGGIAHEVNNPLTIISGIASLLQKKIAKDNFDKEYFLQNLQKIETTTHRISEIIMNLKTFSKDPDIEKKQETSLNNIIAEAMSFCGEKIKNHSISLSQETNENFTIKAHSSQLAQALINILENAFDAVTKLEDKWIKIETQKNDAFIEIRITDSGQGIAEDISSHMMEPFFTTKDVGEGTGLGLSISHGIIASHGGQLQYNKDFPHTQFLIKLPF